MSNKHEDNHNNNIQPAILKIDEIFKNYGDDNLRIDSYIELIGERTSHQYPNA